MALVKLKFPWFAPTEVALKTGQKRDVKDADGRSAVSVSGVRYRPGVHDLPDHLLTMLPSTAEIVDADTAKAIRAEKAAAKAKAEEDTLADQVKGEPQVNVYDEDDFDDVDETVSDEDIEISRDSPEYGEDANLPAAAQDDVTQDDDEDPLEAAKAEEAKARASKKPRRGKK